MTIIFDPEKHFLGKLRRHGHEWENTSQSLRIPIKSGYHRCAVCADLHDRRHTGNTEHHKKVYSEYGKSWYEKNRDHLREQRKVYREVNSEKLKKRNADYRLANREKLRQSGRDYYQRNSDRVSLRVMAYRQTPKGRQVPMFCIKRHQQTLAYKHKHRLKESLRRARIRNNHSFSYELNEVFKKFDGECAYCCKDSKKLTVDHFIPISLGGPDTLLG
jgi:5-methylcytosine-specific restriction endonuclease McrA